MLYEKLFQKETLKTIKNFQKFVFNCLNVHFQYYLRVIFLHNQSLVWFSSSNASKLRPKAEDITALRHPGPNAGPTDVQTWLQAAVSRPQPCVLLQPPLQLQGPRGPPGGRKRHKYRGKETDEGRDKEVDWAGSWQGTAQGRELGLFHFTSGRGGWRRR